MLVRQDIEFLIRVAETIESDFPEESDELSRIAEEQIFELNIAEQED